jgi:hypothetical protein
MPTRDTTAETKVLSISRDASYCSNSNADSRSRDNRSVIDISSNRDNVNNN